MSISESGNVTLQISVDINGPILEVEERIQQVLNGAGCKLTEKALEQFDTDGSPVMTGSIKWTRRCRNTLCMPAVSTQILAAPLVLARDLSCSAHEGHTEYS